MPQPSDFLRYKIYKSSVGISGPYESIGLTSGFSIKDSQISPGNTYYYYVTTLTKYINSSNLFGFQYEESEPSLISSVSFPASSVLNTGIGIYGLDALSYTTTSNNVKISTYPIPILESGDYSHYYENISSEFKSEYINVAGRPKLFKYELVAGQIPKGLELIYYSTEFARLIGIPKIELFTVDPVTEISYPIAEPTLDRYYFVLKSTSIIDKTNYCEKLFHLDIEKDWCAIRDEYIEKVKNQSFSINRTASSNIDFLNFMKSSGKYTCP